MFLSLSLSPDITLPEPQPEKSTVNGNDVAQTNNVINLLGSSQFVASGKNILLIQNNSTIPVYELGDGYVYRWIKLNIPAGTTPGTFITSNKNWFIRTMKPKVDQTISYDALYEVSPQDGSILREISTTLSLSDIACAVSENLIAFRLTSPSSGPPVPVMQSARLP